MILHSSFVTIFCHSTINHAAGMQNLGSPLPRSVLCDTLMRFCRRGSRWWVSPASWPGRAAPATSLVINFVALTAVPRRCPHTGAQAVPGAPAPDRAKPSQTHSTPSVHVMAWTSVLRQPALPTASHAFSSLFQRSTMPMHISCRRRQIHASPVVCGRRSAKIATRKVLPARLMKLVCGKPVAAL